LRIALSAVLIWIMLNPQTFLPRQQSGKPRLIVLVDTSASMGTRDVGQESRIDTAKRVLANPKTLAALNKEFVLDLRRFDRTAAPFSVAPSPRPSPPVGE